MRQIRTAGPVHTKCELTHVMSADDRAPIVGRRRERVDEDEVAVGKVRSAGKVCAECDNGAKSRVVAEERNGDRRGRPAGSLVFIQKPGHDPESEGRPGVD